MHIENSKLQVTSHCKSKVLTVKQSEDYHTIIERLQKEFNVKDNVLGLKVGRAGDEVIDTFSPWANIGDYLKKNQLYPSRTKLYLVSGKHDEPENRCTCESELPHYEITFRYENVSMFSKSTTQEYLTSCVDREAFHPLQYCTLHALMKCSVHNKIYLDHNSEDNGETFTYVYPKLTEEHPFMLLKGYHEGVFLCVIIQDHQNLVNVSWRKNGKTILEHPGLYMLWPKEPGPYSCIVNGQETEIVFVNQSDLSMTPYTRKRKSLEDRKPLKVMGHQSILPADEPDLVAESKSKKPKTPTTKASQSAVHGCTDVYKIDKKELSILEEIGEGGFGRVFKADLHGTNVAYKKCNIPKRGQSSAIEKIVNNEVHVHSSLRHPNIIQFMGIVSTKGEIGLVTELLHHNLESVIFPDEGECSLSDEKLHYITIQILQGLNYLHKLSYIHADIKPANILLSSDLAQVKLCDMGLTRIKRNLENVTRTKSVIPGTAMYMCPESMVKGFLPNKSSDVWSLGATLSELYTQEDFWDIKSVEEIRRKMLQKETSKTLVKLKATYEKVHDVVKACLSYNWGQRPSVEHILTTFKNM